MLDRDGYPPGVPCWIDTEQPDPLASADFYGGLFGWKFTDRMPPDVPGHYLVGELEGRAVAAVSSPDPSAGPASPVWNTYIGVDDADRAAERVRTAGGRVVAEPFDVSDAGRMAICHDPAGASFRLWQPGRTRGAELVNAPGTWNFSDLNARHLEQAKAFYGEVFGWVSATFDLGETTATLWMLPGYGEFLARRDPELWERQAADGTPEGFADAVAWLVDMNAAMVPDEVSPFWSVTFSVDDADAVVDRATNLGAAIVSPVTDLGVVRVATLRDPQGAEFIVSKYQPG
jgi:predicted enzyme related to lactoylglutathione lyase